MHWEPLAMAAFLATLGAFGVYARRRGGRPLPRITQQWDPKRGRTVSKGHFEVALYELSPSLWLAWSWLTDVVVAAALVGGVVWCLRLAVAP